MLVRDLLSDNACINCSENYIDKPLVTIIYSISNGYNSEIIKKSIGSILAQSFRNFELIIVDDSTSDDIAAICSGFVGYDNRIKIIRHINKITIPAVCVDEAYSISQGSFIAFELAGSIWEEYALKLTVDFFVDNNIRAGYGTVKRYNGDSKLFLEFGNNQLLVDNSILCANCLAKSGIAVHRDVLEDVGLFDPHIALVEEYDWDLWRRIIHKYEFISTGICFSTEYSSEAMEQQIGWNNSKKWFVAEYFQLRGSNERLKPENFENIDVFEVPHNGASGYFVDNMHELSSTFDKKVCYVKKSADKNDSIILKTKRILVVCFGAVTASAMSFTEYDGEDFVFCYTLSDSIDISLLLMVDIVIQMRGLPDDNWYVHLCNALSIPVYYYVDDNFREIYKNRNDIPEYVNCNREYLSIYEGVIVSSRKLQTYYKDNYLHENVLYLPPILSKKICSKNTFHEHINIGFMGGGFREEVLIHSVLPGLFELASRYDIMLVLPDDDILRKSLKNCKTIKVTWYQRTSNYCQIINKLNGFGIDILLHTGVDAPNNEYKTKNCLGNAVLLDAVLITSKIKPYVFVDEFVGAYLMSENIVSSWHDVIEKVLSDRLYADSIKELAKETCNVAYSTKYGWEELKVEFLSKIREYNLVFRSEYLLDYEKKLLYKNSQVQKGILPVNIASVRDIDSQEIVFHPIQDYKKYRFDPKRFAFDTLILAFARDLECEGNICLSLYNLEGKLLSKKSIDINDTVRDGLTYVKLNSVVKCEGKDLILQVNVRNEKSGQCGLFEIINRRSLCYRILNHFKPSILGKDVLWIDTI